jgi:hypothetical protein
MMAQWIRSRRATVAGTVAAVLLTIGAGAAVLVECGAVTLEVPDASTLRLKDGEHTIASTMTEWGRFEAKVTVKGRAISEPVYSMGGKVMKPAPESRVPPATLACLKGDDRQPAQDDPEDLGTWGAPPERADPPVAARCKVTSSCVKAIGGGGYCWARANCGGHIGYGFSTY